MERDLSPIELLCDELGRNYKKLIPKNEKNCGKNLSEIR